jgi:hypothetical protein
MSDLPYSAVAGDATCGFLQRPFGVLGSIWCSVLGAH